MISWRIIYGQGFVTDGVYVVGKRSGALGPEIFGSGERRAECFYGSGIKTSTGNLANSK
jgi:hypothetical protein